jgi:hypothetical protein
METLDARRTIATAADAAAGDRLRGLLRAQLTASEREMFDLGYLDPTAPQFAVNPVTVSVSSARPADDAAAPMITIYAYPAEAALSPVDVARLHQWLEPNNHRYEPLPGQLFVPSGSRRAISDGMLAMSSCDLGRYMRFLVIRRSGSVELGPGCVGRWPRGEERWIIDTKKLVAQFAQLLHFLVRFGNDFQQVGPWRVFVNIRAAQGAALGHFAEGWAAPIEYENETTLCLEPHVQLELRFAGTEREIDERIRETATRLELAFGFWKPRVYNERTGELELSGVSY